MPKFREFRRGLLFCSGRASCSVDMEQVKGRRSCVFKEDIPLPSQQVPPSPPRTLQEWQMGNTHLQGDQALFQYDKGIVTDKYIVPEKDAIK